MGPLAVGLLVAFLLATPVVAANRGGMIKVIVNFRNVPGALATTTTARRTIERAGGQQTHRYRLINSSSAVVPSDQLSTLRSQPGVKSVERDGRIKALDAELDASWGVKRIGAGNVHDAGNTGQGVKVGVIDTGIDYTHPDLDGVYAGGYDFFNGDADPMDDHGHGTHVAGIIAAENNGQGVVGVAPGARIYAYKVLGANGSGDYSGLISALERATLVDHVNVINMSVGGSTPSDALAGAVTAAYSTGTVIVAASGNVDPSNFQQLLHGCPVVYPAAYPEVFATTFTGQNDQLTGYSCTGPQVDFAAPGDQVNSTVPSGSCPICSASGYLAESGTSMASPHLAGVVALVLAHGIANGGDPTTLADDVKAHLCATASQGFGVNSTPIAPSDPRYVQYFGCGVVDADNALITNPPVGSGDPPPPPPPNQPPVAQDDSATTVQDTAVDVPVLTNDSDPDGNALAIDSVTTPANGTAAVNGTKVHYTPGAGFTGSDAFSYTISDKHGGTATANVALTVTEPPPPPPNQPPVAHDDSATTAQNTAVDVNVLANDSDPEHDALSITSVSAPTNGSAAVNGTAVRYTPAAGFAGSDTFSYTVSDGHGGSATANVSVTVTPSPSVNVADIDAFSSKNLSNWSVRVRVYAESETNDLKQNVTVRGNWDTGAIQSCITNRFGYCEMSLVGIKLTVLSRSYTVTSLTLTGRPYDGSQNHDPDGDSDGTTITVSRP